MSDSKKLFRDSRCGCFLLALLVFVVSVTLGLWGILAIDKFGLIPRETQSHSRLELDEVGHCIRAGYTYSQIETCIGQPANITRGGIMPGGAIIRTYWLADDVQMVLVFTPADSLYSATITWPNGSEQKFLP